MVETVMGPVDAGALGVTLSHEHVFVVMGEDNHHYPWMFDLEATRAKAIRELGEAKAGGIDTIIDLTTPDLGRDVEFVREVAEATGMNVVVATGIWRDVPRSFWARDLDKIADIFVARDRGRHRHDRHQSGRDQGGERRRGRDAGGGAGAARRGARAEAHRLPDQHAPLGAGARRHAAGRDLPGRGRADGPHLHRPQRRHDRRGLPGVAAAIGRVPLDGPLPGRRGPAGLARSATRR